MSTIINLNRHKKAQERAQKRVEAEQNTLKHGQSKAQKNLAKARAEKAARNLAAHQRVPKPTGEDHE